LGLNVISIQVLIQAHHAGIFTQASAFIYVRFFCSIKSDCNICHGMADIAVTHIVDISITVPKRNRLACMSTPATTNQDIFFLIKSFAQSMFIIDLIIIYKNKNHSV